MKITDVRTILTAPAGIRLSVVKVSTDEPGLYGLGCATFTQRPRAVQTAVDTYLRPWISDRPGLGIDIDEKLVARFPIQDDPAFDMEWGKLRRRDGSVQKP